MSKFIEALKAVQTGHRVVVSGSLRFEDFAREHTMPIGLEYKITATATSRAVIEDSKDLPDALAAARRLLVEEVFGEFRQTIAELNVALYERDIMVARRLVRLLHAQMFTA